jgi:hypothetical protein
MKPENPNAPYAAETEPMPCCVELRCKSFYTELDERPGLLRDEEAMGYWCLKTQEPLGPDRELARHCTCQPGRGCFEAGPTGGPVHG